jgi:hypothetical protein
VWGALARHVQAGDAIHAAVLLSRPESCPQVVEAAGILGIDGVEFLDFPYGGWTVDVSAKERIVELVRRVKPDIVITQDPHHAQHDPDRRLIALLYTEAFALAGRDWRIAECGGHAPHLVRAIYYMTPEHLNCIIEIADTFALKQKALAVLAVGIALYLGGDVFFRRAIYIPSSRLRLGLVVASLLTIPLGAWAGGFVQVAVLLGLFILVLSWEYGGAKRSAD